jgi:hypothetical protein
VCIRGLLSFTRSCLGGGHCEQRTCVQLTQLGPANALCLCPPLPFTSWGLVRRLGYVSSTTSFRPSLGLAGAMRSGSSAD